MLADSAIKTLRIHGLISASLQTRDAATSIGSFATLMRSDRDIYKAELSVAMRAKC